MDIVARQTSTAFLCFLVLLLRLCIPIRFAVFLSVSKCVWMLYRVSLCIFALQCVCPHSTVSDHVSVCFDFSGCVCMLLCLGVFYRGYFAVFCFLCCPVHFCTFLRIVKLLAVAVRFVRFF